MNDKTGRLVLEHMFFQCWHFSRIKVNYTDVLRATMELAEQFLPCTMKAVREGHVWENWQRNYNDPHGWVPQIIADDSLLNAFTTELLDNFNFGSHTDWYLEVVCISRSVENKLGVMQFSYANMVCDGHKMIGKYQVFTLDKLVNEIQNHLKYLRQNKNPYAVPCE